MQSMSLLVVNKSQTTMLCIDIILTTKHKTVDKNMAEYECTADLRHSENSLPWEPG